MTEEQTVKEREQEEPQNHEEGDSLKTIEGIDQEIDQKAESLAQLRDGFSHYALLLDPTGTTISDDLVDHVYEELRRRFGADNDRLLVIVASGGGYIDPAYNLATLFRRYGKKQLIFVVPRWAKSAATLLVCGGDKILMSPIAELGPLDPQITETNPMDGRYEHFSPLHIKSTLDLINAEYKAGNKEIADALVNRLQFPLTLGSFRKSLDVGKAYLAELLGSRMLTGKLEHVKEVSARLVEGYVDHSACIKCGEVEELGLVVEELAGDELDLAWEIHRLGKRKARLIREQRIEEINRRIKDLPPDILDAIGDGLSVPQDRGKER